MGRDLSRNDIPILILSVLSESANHGYAIAREVERRSADVFHLREGSLYPALRVLEQDGAIEGRWEIPESGPKRKVYEITKKGRRELSKRAQEWADYRETLNIFIGGKANARTA